MQTSTSAALLWAERSGASVTTFEPTSVVAPGVLQQSGTRSVTTIWHQGCFDNLAPGVLQQLGTRGVTTIWHQGCYNNLAPAISCVAITMVIVSEFRSHQISKRIWSDIFALLCVIVWFQECNTMDNIMASPE